MTANSSLGGLKSLGESGFFEHAIGSVARQYRVVYCEVNASYWAAPNLMVATALPDEIASGSGEFLLKLSCEVRHVSARAGNVADLSSH